MRKVGMIKEIWRYPVKGMGGERLASCSLGKLGLEGDRRWALRDINRDEIQSCKFRPELLRCTARNADDAAGGVVIVLPDGRRLEAGQARIDEQLSKLVGHRSCLEPLSIDAHSSRFRRFHGGEQGWLEELKATFERVEGEPLPDFDSLPPSVAEYVSLPGTFFLVAPIHLITTATLERLARLQSEEHCEARRFRANLLIETAPGEADFIEQGWIGRQLAVGDALIDCTGATPRCGAITRSQRDFGEHRAVLRTVVKHANQNAGIYASMRSPGLLREGDAVWLL